MTVEAGLPFVTKTYLMEGDGDIVVDAYDNLQEVATAAELQNYPNTRALAKKYAAADEKERLKRPTKKHGDACGLLSPTSCRNSTTKIALSSALCACSKH